MKPPRNHRSGGSPRVSAEGGAFRAAGPDRPSGSRAGDPRPKQRAAFKGNGASGAGGPHGSKPRGNKPYGDKPHGGGGPRFPDGPQRGSQPGPPPHGRHRPDQPSGDGSRSDKPRQAAETPRGTVWLYGQHAVAAALANPARRLRRLLLTEEAEATLARHHAPPWALAPEHVDRGRLDYLLGRDIAHQGAALLADPLAPPPLQSVLDKPGVILVLDQVTDPRNVGAILRSAAAFSAAAVITQDRNAPEETGALAKAASGALETMPLLRAVNIARTLIALKAANVWCVGLDAGGAPLAGPGFANRRVALVLGAEGEGLRRLTRDTCDEIAGLAIKGAVESLNVSAAAAVALYELGRR